MGFVVINVRNIAIWAGISLGLGQPIYAQQVDANPALFAEGVDLYADHCSICHGDEGDGNGPLADSFSPPPRDLVNGSFKFRSTGLGEMPTEADLRKTIQNGIAGPNGRSMPSFYYLSDREIRALAEVIRVIAGSYEFGTAVIPSQRPTTPDLVLGKKLYTDLNCAGCHGDEGDGNGVLAPELLDSNGLLIKPADLRLGQFKGGNEPKDIWMRVYAGLDGTPMPSFGRNSTGDEIWAVVEYVIKFSE